MPLPLPPLNALRAFEAAARTGGYVLAAGELGVSPAAVSQQVRLLEDFLGKKLFRRFNNRVVLTEAGTAVASGASEALQQISTLTRNIRTGEGRARLVVSVLPSVAHRWLAPRLARFAAATQGLKIDLRVEDDPVDFARHDIDLRLGYGSSLYPDHADVPLVNDEAVAVCSPGFLDRRPGIARQGMAAAAGDDLIHTDWGPSFVSHPSWPSWFGAAGLEAPALAKGHRSSMSGLAMDLARDGLGVALGPRLLAIDDLNAGRLVLVSQLAVPLAHPYCLAFARNRSRDARVMELVAALMASARDTANDSIRRKGTS